MTAPANDNFADAETITGWSGTVTGSNVDATLEAGELTPSYSHGSFGDGDRSIWYRWVAPADGAVTFDTNGSTRADNGTPLDTVLDVWTGTAVDALSLIAADDDSGDINNSLVTFDAVEGETYYIRVNGFSASYAFEGEVVLNWLGTPAPAPVGGGWSVG